MVLVKTIKTMTPNIFQRRLNIVDFIAKQGRQTLDQIAKALNISLSSVWRHQKAIEPLHADPVSQFWSSPAGMRYLITLFAGTIRLYFMALLAFIFSRSFSWHLLNIIYSAK